MSKKILLNLIAMAMVGALSAKDKAEFIADLKSTDDAVATAAAQHLGKEGVKDAIEPLGELVKSNRATGVRIAAAAALGKMDTKGRPTTILREAIEAEQDNQVLYTELLAILNLKDVNNPDLDKAVTYCEANKAHDRFVADVVKRIRKAFPKK